MDVLREMRVTYTPDRAPATMKFESPRALAAALMPTMELEIVEVCRAIYLTARHTVIASLEIGRGGSDACPVAPVTVLRGALLANAGAFILAHNHPSGDPTPSPEDIALTNRIKAAADLIGITMLDHIIIGHSRYFSMKEFGGIL